jgi:hypothetical protein
MGSYQLLQVPRASLHVALVLIQALCELLRVDLAAPRSPVALLSRTLRQGHLGLLGLRWGSGGAATEETADGVADRGTDCYTTVRNS